MPESKPSHFGTISWADLTIPNAEEIRDFYKDVIGWGSEGLMMKDGEESYPDYVMKDDAGNAVSGVCHARGANKNLPPQWLVYVTVEDVEASLERCTELGGSVLHTSLAKDGAVAYAVIQDPAGAVLAVARES